MVAPKLMCEHHLILALVNSGHLLSASYHAQVLKTPVVTYSIALAFDQAARVACVPTISVGLGLRRHRHFVLPDMCVAIDQATLGEQLEARLRSYLFSKSDIVYCSSRRRFLMVPITAGDATSPDHAAEGKSSSFPLSL